MGSRVLSPPAAALPFDNSSNGFPAAATNVQTAIESVLSFNPVSQPAPLFDDFDGRMTWSPATSGTNAAASVSGGNTTFASGKHNGVARIATGTVLNTSAALVWSGNLSVGLMVGNGVAEYQTLVRIPILSDGTDTYTLRIGLGNSSTVDHANGIYFQHDNTSGNWIIKTAHSNIRTSTTTSIAVATNSWIRLHWICNSAGTQVDYYINGTSAGTITTNIPTTTGSGYGGNFQISNSTVLAAARECFIDYFYYTKQYTARD